ncbi:DUF6125 family protein [Thermodesulfobacteriota bacterium]
MDALGQIDKRDLKELLIKGWMTHDAMWLYHCNEKCGIEKANEINLAAVLSMSAIEIQRVKKALGFNKDKIETFDELADLLIKTMEIVKADFMRFHWNVSAKNVLHWEWEGGSCFAYEGVTKLGVIDQYQCGIIKRIEGWLRALGVEYKIDPPIVGCLLHKTGSCKGDFIKQRV